MQLKQSFAIFISFIFHLVWLLLCELKSLVHASLLFFSSLVCDYCFHLSKRIQLDIVSETEIFSHLCHLDIYIERESTWSYWYGIKMASIFANVEVGPKIEVFALNKLYVEDTSSVKVNLGVGGKLFTSIWDVFFSLSKNRVHYIWMTTLSSWISIRILRELWIVILKLHVIGLIIKIHETHNTNWQSKVIVKVTYCLFIHMWKH